MSVERVSCARPAVVADQSRSISTFRLLRNLYSSLFRLLPSSLECVVAHLARAVVLFESWSCLNKFKGSDVGSLVEIELVEAVGE